MDIPIVADCNVALTAINKYFAKESEYDPQSEAERYQPWFSMIKEWTEKHPLSYCTNGEIIKPQFVIETLDRLTGGDAIITTEVGQNQMWTAQFFRFNKPKRFITSGGLGTMGFGLPAAIGAQIAFPDKYVIDIAGDGSIQMNIQELATAKQYNCPIKIAILNNGFLGMVKQWQELFYEKRYSSTVMDVTPDFVELAKAFGAVGLRATKASEVEPVIKEALSTKSTVLMDFVISQDENVYPMVPAGKATTEMLLV